MNMDTHRDKYDDANNPTTNIKSPTDETAGAVAEKRVKSLNQLQKCLPACSCSAETTWPTA